MYLFIVGGINMVLIRLSSLQLTLTYFRIVGLGEILVWLETVPEDEAAGVDETGHGDTFSNVVREAVCLQSQDRHVFLAQLGDSGEQCTWLM